ncbi:hypothetical protein Tco_0658750 [Tanacetum coccineum]
MDKRSPVTQVRGKSISSQCKQDVHLATDPEMSCREELHQFDRLQSGTLVDNPFGKNEEGIDFEESFAPVARLEAVRIFVAYTDSLIFDLKKSLPSKESSIWIETSSESPDADHAGCVYTRKSTSGGIQFLGDKLVNWMSKKQDCHWQMLSDCGWNTWSYFTPVPSTSILGIISSKNSSQAVNKSPTHYPCDSARTFRVILFSIHNDEWKSFQCHHQTALRRPYALSWKPCQGDSLNLPDHRIHKDGDGDASFQLKSDSLPHAHAQTTKTFYKHQDSRIMKAQELKTKTSAQTLIYKIFLQRYQVYQGRLLASFQDDA